MKYFHLLLLLSAKSFIDAQDTIIVYPLKSNLPLIHIDEGIVDHGDAGADLFVVVPR